MWHTDQVTAELARTTTTGLERRTPRAVHDAVRDQLLAEMGADRLDRLRALLDGPTFNEVLHWLSSAKRAALPTKRGYADDIAKIAAWAVEHFGTRPLPLLERMDAEAVTVWSVYCRSQDMAVRTHRRALSALSSLFTYAARHGWTVANPVSFEDHARPVGTSDNGRPAGATRVLEVAEVARMHTACQTTEERLVFGLLCVQGLRESEVVNMRVEHIDRKRSPTVVNVQRKRGQWVERELSTDTMQLVGAHLEDRDAGPLLLDPKTGEARNRHQLIDLTRRLARRAMIPHPLSVTPHVLRAVAITALLNKGKPVQEVQKWAGHASPKTTQGYWERHNGVKRDAALSGELSALIASAEAELKNEQEADQ